MARAGLALAATAVALGLALPSASASRPLFGFNDLALLQGTPPERFLPLFERTGARVHRMDVEWRWVQPEPGQWRWELPDRVYRPLSAAGVKVILVVRRPPDWAQDDAFLPCGLLGSQDCQLPPSRERLEEWAEFVRATVARYPDAVALEVFNEPNYAPFWRPAADPGHYVQVLKAAYLASKAVRPGLPVLFGGLLNIDETRSPGSVALDRFLEEAYAAGARGAMDAIAVHPYGYPQDSRESNSPYRSALARLRAVRDRAGDGNLPLWITEVGYHTGPAASGGVSPARQADLVVAVVKQALSEPDVDAVLVHSLVDRGTEESDPLDNFGLVQRDLRPKPAFSALVALTGVPIISQVRVRRRPRLPRPALLRLRLSEAALVRVVFERCARVSQGRCTRLRPARELSRSLPAGPSRIPFSLPRGRYRASVWATDSTGERSTPIRRRFRLGQ